MLRQTRPTSQSILSPAPRRCAIVGLAMCLSLVCGVAQSEAATLKWRPRVSFELSRMFRPFGSLTIGAATALSGESNPVGTLPRVLVGNMPQAAAFDPATRTVYVANQSDNTLSVVDTRSCNDDQTSSCGQKPATVATGNAPFAIAIDDATHTIYVTNSGDNSVSVINAATCNSANTSGCGQTPATVAVGPTPFGLAVDPATDTVYAANIGAGNGDTVSVIDGARCNATNTSGCGQTPATATVGQAPFSIAVDPTTKTVYVTDGAANAVSMIDERTCRAGFTSGCRQTAPTAAVGSTPVSVAVDQRTDTVYVGNSDDATVSLIDTATCNAHNTSGCGRAPVTLSTAGAPDGLTVNDRTDTLFVSNGGPGNFSPGTNNPARDNTVSIINAAKCNANDSSGCGQPAPMALTGAGPSAAAVDATTNTAYVATGDNALTLINAATCSATVKTGCGQRLPATFSGSVPLSAAIDQATHTVYVGNAGAFGGIVGFPNTISVLDAATCNTVVSTGCNPTPPAIPMQFAPVGAAVDQATDTIYATNFADSNGNIGNTVSVIDGTTCNASVTTGCGSTPPTVTVGSAPNGVAVDQASDTIYVANAGDNTVSVINGATCNATNTAGCGQTTPTVALGSSPVAIAVNQATDTIYVLNPGTPGTVSVIDGATCNRTVTTGCGKVPPTITVGNGNGGEFAGLAVDASTNTIYVVNAADDTVSVIDGATCNRNDTSGCGQTPTHVAVGRQSLAFVTVDPTADLVYVSDHLDDAVSVIDGTSCNGAVTSGCDQNPPMVPAGAHPTAIAVNLANHTIYVADGGGPVSFFKFRAPGRPDQVTATAPRGQVELAWQPPYDGGLPIIYHIIPSPSCATCTGLTTPSTSGIPATTVSGLTRGQTYRFKVKATDAAGTGPTSAPSNPVRP